MQLAKMCRAVGQNVCTICVLMAMLCPGGDTRSRQPLKELGDAMGKATPVSMGHNVSNQNIHSVLEDAISEKSKFFLKKLFQKYGTNGSMTFEGFEHFLENLGLANIRITDHDLLDHKDGRGFKNLHSSDHSHAVTWPKDFKSHDHSGEQQNVPNINDHSHFKQDSHLHEDRSSQQKDLHDHSHDHHNDDHSRRKRQVHKLKSSYSKLYSTKNAKHSLTRVKRQESHGHESHSSHEHDHGSHDGHELHDHGSPDSKSTNGHDSLDQKSNDDHDEHKSHDHDHAHSDELHGHLSDNNDPLSHQDQKEPRGSDAKLAAVPNTRNRKKPGRKRGRKRGGSRKKVTDKSLGGTVSPNLQQMMWDKVCPDGICDQQCLSARELLVMFNLPPTSSIEEVTFLEMCPVLMYQLDSRSCRNSEKGSLGKKVIVGDHSGHDHSNRSAASSSHKSAPAKVWGYSVMAVLIVSAVGLLSVAIIPIIGKVFYNHLLQFLVALAVGALSGDALLHLIPHAMEMGSSDNHAPHGQEDSHGHDSRSIWIGLMALAGIYIFFMLERVVTIITEIKNKNKQNNKRTSPVYLDKEGDFSRTVGAKLSGHVESCEEMVMVVHPNKALKEYAKGTTLLADCEEDHENEKINNEEAMPTVTYEHGHGHGHSHEVPTSVAALAWMVILGDGIHNFTDGLAIGAAFSSSITGGISTTIAIFCHELPHEIGDFAVLLRAGMSVKRALVYNCVSSILCLIGMVIGVPLGNLDNASVWIFAMVGGMFIYIAFVDMLPEMTAVGTKKGEHPFCHLAFQVFGLLCGAGIMLLIAIYEHDIKTSLEP